MHGFWWSPDSRWIVYEEANTAGVEELSIADPSHPERPPQLWRYPRAGKNNAQVRLGVVPAAGGETRWLDWDRSEFPYLARVIWQKNSPLVILVQNREQTLEVLYEVDPQTGNKKELLRESDPAWVNLDGEMPHWRRDGKSFLWSSERTGHWQLELHHRDGSLARVVDDSGTQLPASHGGRRGGKRGIRRGGQGADADADLSRFARKSRTARPGDERAGASPARLSRRRAASPFAARNRCRKTCDRLSFDGTVTRSANSKVWRRSRRLSPASS